jgi:hypothetical protein
VAIYVPQERCIDCGAASPKLDEELTLRSTLGWRLTRERMLDGTIVPVWRCPECHQKRKDKKP